MKNNTLDHGLTSSFNPINNETKQSGQSDKLFTASLENNSKLSAEISNLNSVQRPNGFKHNLIDSIDENEHQRSEFRGNCNDVEIIEVHDQESKEESQTEFNKFLNLIKTSDLKRKPINYLRNKWPLRVISQASYIPDHIDLIENYKMLVGNSSDKLWPSDDQTQEENPGHDNSKQLSPRRGSVDQSGNRYSSFTNWNDCISLIGFSSELGKQIIATMWPMFGFNKIQKLNSVLNYESIQRTIKISSNDDEEPTRVTRNKKYFNCAARSRSKRRKYSHTYHFNSSQRRTRLMEIQRQFKQRQNGHQIKKLNLRQKKK